MKQQSKSDLNTHMYLPSESNKSLEAYYKEAFLRGYEQIRDGQLQIHPDISENVNQMLDSCLFLRKQGNLRLEKYLSKIKFTRIGEKIKAIKLDSFSYQEGKNRQKDVFVRVVKVKYELIKLDEFSNYSELIMYHFINQSELTQQPNKVNLNQKRKINKTNNNQQIQKFNEDENEKEKQQEKEYEQEKVERFVKQEVEDSQFKEPILQKKVKQEYVNQSDEKESEIHDMNTRVKYLERKMKSQNQYFFKKIADIEEKMRCNEMLNQQNQQLASQLIQAEIYNKQLEIQILQSQQEKQDLQAKVRQSEQQHQRSFYKSESGVEIDNNVILIN